MNKTLGSTLITSGTMIGAGMLAMPLTSARSVYVYSRSTYSFVDPTHL